QRLNRNARGGKLGSSGRRLRALNPKSLPLRPPLALPFKHFWPSK
ncbi:hypothetical protein M5D96_009233, partial [Drosophila gunungcola]